MRPDGNQRQFWRTKISKCAKKLKTITRCSEVGIAPVSGTGDRGFESRHFDQDRLLTVFFLGRSERTLTPGGFSDGSKI